jgi:hypothetical protein
MSFFNDILTKLGIKKPAAPAPAPTAPKTQVYKDSRPVIPMQPAGTKYPDIKGAPPVLKAIPEVDVVAKLEKLAKENPQKLDWKVSIVDLLKLLGIDSSLTARKELAVELGCPSEKMADSAQMNVWLHKEVLRRIAMNGGNIPANLLD